MTIVDELAIVVGSATTITSSREEVVRVLQKTLGEHQLRRELVQDPYMIERVYRLAAERNVVHSMNGKKNEKFDAYLREGTWDHGIVGESRTYLPMGISNDDVVMDVGGNIGTFARFALKQGAKRVLTFEPDAENFQVLLANNLDNIPSVVAIRAAIIGSETKTQMRDGDEFIEFFLNESGSNKGLHSMVHHRGRPSVRVPAVRFNEAQYRLSDPITALKIDIEGGEYFIGLQDIVPTVKKLAIEWHLARDEFRGMAREGEEIVKSLGFVPIRPLVITERGRAYLSIYKRD